MTIIWNTFCLMFPINLYLITLYIFLVLNFQTSMYKPNSQQKPTYLWTDLEPATEYTFHVYACNGYHWNMGTHRRLWKAQHQTTKADCFLIWWSNANSTKFMLLIFSNLHCATTLEGDRSCHPILCLSQISMAPQIPISTHNRRTHETGV